MGLLSARGPPSWHPASNYIKEACKEAAVYCTAHGVDISKLAMHFSLSNEEIPTTLVSTASLERLKDNIAAVNATLDATEQQVTSHIMSEYFRLESFVAGTPLEFVLGKKLGVPIFTDDALSVALIRPFFLRHMPVSRLGTGFELCCSRPLEGRETWGGIEVGKYFESVGRAFVHRDLYENRYAPVAK